MGRRRIVKIGLLAAGASVMSLFPGCLLPLIPLLPLGSRLAGNALVDLLLSLSR